MIPIAGLDRRGTLSVVAIDFGRLQRILRLAAQSPGTKGQGDQPPFPTRNGSGGVDAL
jgi:hypothetical protein